MTFTINKHLYHRFRKVHLNVPLELFNMVWFAFSLRNDFCLRKYFFSHRYWTSTLQLLKAVKTFFGYFSFCEKYILKECLQCKLLIFTFLSKHSIHIYKKSTKTLLFVISFLSWMHCKVMQYISCFNTLYANTKVSNYFYLEFALKYCIYYIYSPLLFTMDQY